MADWIARGIVAASTLLLLETRAGRDLPPADPEELPSLWISERAERRAATAAEMPASMSATMRRGVPSSRLKNSSSGIA